MSNGSPLSDIWLSLVETSEASPPDLETVLQNVWQAGVDAWPGVTLSAADFVRHLGRHCPREQGAKRFLTNVAARDLYLACACARGDRAALLALEKAVLAQVPSFVRGIDPSPDFANEVTQVLRERLLVAVEGGAPRIAEYGGQGALFAFVRVAALRTALNLRRNRDDRSMDDVNDLAMADVGGDPELGYLRVRSQEELREALRTAFASLPLEQRNVVRMHFGRGLSAEQIGVVLQVNRSTVGRWLASARVAMLHETRRLLWDRLRLSPADLESLLAAIGSRLDMSLTSLMQEPEAEGDGAPSATSRRARS